MRTWTMPRSGFEPSWPRSKPRLRRALVAAYGSERGRDAVAEALAFAWERWPEVETMTNAASYLYRVGQSRTRGRKVPVVFTRRGAGRDGRARPRRLA